ncbi:SAM-dependent methyltransferase [Aquincola sp. S2]|uniref:SAM-dependent methyltransferase n=1 Tax=Pseudaquabacterium terrae TaxID=2732868 RepID=A0ABX2EI69_9BURK|nr:SAM-dependent methyltransferase [Aquabacterium terrae]NRF68276.1 SAM-dependent methyltransferase [Aquabacterium terrae]
MKPDSDPTTDVDATQQFIQLVTAALGAERFVKGSLAKYRGPEADLQRVLMRRVMLREQPHLQLVHRHATKDITKNHALADVPALLQGLLGEQAFRHAHLHATDEEIELVITQRGKAGLHRRAANVAAEAPSPATHNREKTRWLTLDRPFLAELGVTSGAQQLVPAMARKWKQINKFVEVFAHALDASPLKDARQLRVVDFGSGKGYLTFAIHDWLRAQRGIEAQVTGVELRPDMVQLGNHAAARLGLQGLRFEQGDLRHWQPQPLNVMIALHACDTATDLAIDLGLRGGADIILCSPCCHKQIRPQLLQPHPLKPILQHGVHLGQQAEMLTDGLRALWLEACGYDTQVFEFISLEHTNKNKMILAVRRASPKPRAPLLQQIDEVKRFYGIREHCLETLLRQRAALEPASSQETM